MKGSRAREIASLGEALAEGRLATIIGPGGMGKTRLARRFCEARAHAYPGGVWFCELSHGRTAEDICVALARALDLRGAPPTLVERLGDALAARGACAVVLDGVDGVLLWLNIVFLLSISFMPFTPAVYRAQVRIYLHGLAMLFYLRRTPHLASAIIMGIGSWVPDALASE